MKLANTSEGAKSFFNIRPPPRGSKCLSMLKNSRKSMPEEYLPKKISLFQQTLSKCQESGDKDNV